MVIKVSIVSCDCGWGVLGVIGEVGDDEVGVEMGGFEKVCFDYSKDSEVLLCKNC